MRNRKIYLGLKKIYSEEFKKARVKEYETGVFTVRQICKLYQIPGTATIYRWIYKYSAYNSKGIKIVELEESSTKKVKDLQDQIADLERRLGQKQIKIDYLETMIEVAKDELDIDIKKNSSTLQSKK